LHLLYVHIDNLLYAHVKVTKKYTASLLVTSKKICLEVNVKETKYFLISSSQSARKNHEIKMANKYLWLFNVNQQNAHFLNKCFKSIRFNSIKTLI